MHVTDMDKLKVFLPELKEEQLIQFSNYCDAIQYFNAKINLISDAALEVVAQQHFSDSILGLNLIAKQKKFSGDVYDFGSGNGFPGVVLAILEPDVAVHLVERDIRKAEFLKHVSGELGLKNIVVKGIGIEKLPKHSVDFGITRALGSISNVLIQTNSIFNQGGSIYHFKSDTWTSEVASCPTQIFANWDIQEAGQYYLPETNIHRFIIQASRLG